MQPIEINKHQFFKIELLEVPYSKNAKKPKQQPHLDHIRKLERLSTQS